jgi:hypothetical protein
LELAVIDNTHRFSFYLKELAPEAVKVTGSKWTDRSGNEETAASGSTV